MLGKTEQFKRELAYSETPKAEVQLEVPLLCKMEQSKTIKGNMQDRFAYLSVKGAEQKDAYAITFKGREEISKLQGLDPEDIKKRSVVGLVRDHTDSNM